MVAYFVPHLGIFKEILEANCKADLWLRMSQPSIPFKDLEKLLYC